MSVVLILLMFIDVVDVLILLMFIDVIDVNDVIDVLVLVC